MADDPVDEIAPWTIKSVATRTRQKVMIAAKKEGLTAGQWLEKRVDEWEAEGGPTVLQTRANPVGEGASGSDLGAFVGHAAAYLQGAAAAHAAGLPISRKALNRVQAATEARMREAQGLPPLQPRLPPPRAPSPTLASDEPGAPPAMPGKARALPGE